MKMSFISPTKYIKEFQSQGDFILALSHLIDHDKENDYEKAIKETKLPILLDNGAFENSHPEGIDSLIRKARKIKAEKFFAPDHLFNSKATKDAVNITIDILKTLQQRKHFKVGAVVQADNPKDWIDQYVDFTENSEIDFIGLSILSIPKSWGKSITESRIECFKELIKLNIEHKSCHMLGLGENYEDIKFAIKNCPWIESNDTSSCFMTGLNKIKYDKDLIIPGGKIKEKMNFNLSKLTQKQKECIQYNIDLVKKLN